MESISSGHLAYHRNLSTVLHPRSPRRSRLPKRGLLSTRRLPRWRRIPMDRSRDLISSIDACLSLSPTRHPRPAIPRATSGRRCQRPACRRPPDSIQSEHHADSDGRAEDQRGQTAADSGEGPRARHPRRLRWPRMGCSSRATASIPQTSRREEDPGTLAWRDGTGAQPRLGSGLGRSIVTGLVQASDS